MNKLITLLEAFINNPKKKFINKPDEWGSLAENRYSSMEDIMKNGPYTLDEIKKYRPFKNRPSTFEKVPKELYNKKIIIGDFELIVLYKAELIDNNDYEKISFDSFLHNRRLNFYHEIGCNVILCYRGVYYMLGKYRDDLNMRVEHGLPHQKNWGHLTFTETNAYMPDEDRTFAGYSYYEGLDEILSLIDVNNSNLVEADIEFQPWYDSSFKGKSLKQYSLKKIDFDSFITQEIKDGVYKPESLTINEIIIPFGELAKKDLLNKLGVHTVHLRSNSYYNVKEYFSLKGIKIKAPKSVIKAFNLEKYCEDINIVKELDNEWKTKLKEAELEEYNDKYTLVQHGKIIFENHPKNEIIHYLEKVSVKNIDSKIIESIKPLFEIYDLNKIYLCYFGQYYAYELKGEKCDINWEVHDKNLEIISEDILNKIYDLHIDNIYFDINEREIEILYGWPEMKIELLGVQKNKKGKLEVFFENYDYL